MIRIAICENDAYYLNKEKQLLEEYLGQKSVQYEITTIHSETELTVNYKEEYDIIFLDISMEKMDGLDVARKIREKDTKAYIVFLTAYSEYSLEGYKVGAHRYLLKNDVNIKEALCECMDSILQKFQDNEVRVELKVLGGALLIAPSKILFAESKVHRVTIHVLENSGEVREYYMYDRLDHVQELLDGYGFLRIHQSYLINREYLKTVSRYKVEMIQGICLGISKKYYKEIEEYYIRMRGEF